jgi:hypothetical protein
MEAPISFKRWPSPSSASLPLVLLITIRAGQILEHSPTSLSIETLLDISLLQNCWCVRSMLESVAASPRNSLGDTLYSMGIVPRIYSTGCWNSTAVARPLQSAKPMFWTGGPSGISGIHGSSIFSRLCIYMTAVPAQKNQVFSLCSLLHLAVRNNTFMGTGGGRLQSSVKTSSNFSFTLA